MLEHIVSVMFYFFRKKTGSKDSKALGCDKIRVMDTKIVYCVIVTIFQFTGIILRIQT